MRVKPFALLALLLICAFSVHAAITDNLVASYSLDNATTGYQDFTGISPTLSVTGTVTSVLAKINNGSRSTAQNTNYLTAGISLKNQNATIALFMQHPNAASDDNLICWHSGSPAPYMCLEAQSKNASLRIWTGAAGCLIDSKTPISDGKNHSVVGVWNGDNGLLYVDGVNVQNGTGCSVVSIASTSTFRPLFGTAGGTDMVVDEVSAWNRSLSATEIQQWNASPRYPFFLQNANLTITALDLITNTNVTGLCGDFSSTNASNSTITMCNATGTLLRTNFTGTYNVSLRSIGVGVNASAGTYWDNATIGVPFDFTGNVLVQIQTSPARYQFNVTNRVNASPVAGMNVTLSAGSQAYTNATNASGIASLLVPGNATQTGNWSTDGINWFRISSSVNATSPINQTTPLWPIQVYQALLNLTASQLYTNTSILSFNATNALTFNQTATGSLLLPANNGSNNVLVQVLGNYSQNLSCTVLVPLQTVNCNATGVYDDLFTIGANASGVSVANFTVNVSNTSISGLPLVQNTTNGSVMFALLQGYFYFFQMQATGYAYSNASLPANASTNLYNFTLFTANKINFTFYDEQTNQTITLANITLDMIGNLTGGREFWTTNGTLSTTVLSPDTYTLRYYGVNLTGGANYTTRFWYLTLVNNTAPSLRLPMLKASQATLVQGSVVSSTSVPVPDKTIKVYKYDPFSGAYVLNQIVISNTQGQFTVGVQFANELYYFTVEDASGILLQTEPSYVYTTTLDPFVITLLPGGFTALFAANNIIGNITFTNATSTATFTYDDLDNIATQGCLYTYQYATSGKTLVAQTCAATSAGLITSTITANGTWEFQGIVTKSGIQQLSASYQQSYANSLTGEGTGKIGLFVLFFVILFFIIILRNNLPGMSAIVGMLPLLFSIVGLISISVAYTLPIALLGVGLALFLANSPQGGV
jgi:hypothetical protein